MGHEIQLYWLNFEFNFIQLLSYMALNQNLPQNANLREPCCVSARHNLRLCTIFFQIGSVIFQLCDSYCNFRDPCRSWKICDSFLLVSTLVATDFLDGPFQPRSEKSRHIPLGCESRAVSHRS